MIADGDRGCAGTRQRNVKIARRAVCPFAGERGQGDRSPAAQENGTKQAEDCQSVLRVISVTASTTAMMLPTPPSSAVVAKAYCALAMFQTRLANIATAKMIRSWKLDDDAPNSARGANPRQKSPSTMARRRFASPAAPAWSRDSKSMTSSPAAAATITSTVRRSAVPSRCRRQRRRAAATRLRETISAA